MNAMNQALRLPSGYADMGNGATVGMLSNNRLHLQQGPINLVIKAHGEPASVLYAYKKCTEKFAGLLDGLVNELAVLRQPVSADLPAVVDSTAQRMVRAARRFPDEFVTPMAAVAGAVADEIMSVIPQVPGIDKCFVNNGGDIALYLAANQNLDVGVVPSLAEALAEASIRVHHNAGIGGIATSGWDGHSWSLGIAESVTVLAGNTALADVAATLIANAVNVEHEAIIRQSAVSLDAMSDLGERLVTTQVGELPDFVRAEALEKGAVFAQELVERGTIQSALITLQGECRTVGYHNPDFKIGE